MTWISPEPEGQREGLSDILDTYACARDHSRGPGEWCVIGPGGFKTAVGDRQIGIMLAALLNGDFEGARYSACFYAGEVKNGWRPGS